MTDKSYIEAERRFLVNKRDVPSRYMDAFETNNRKLMQGYLAESNTAIVRVRMCESESKGCITVKSTIDDVQSIEVENEISMSDALVLLALCEAKIQKVRRSVRYAGIQYDMDEFINPVYPELEDHYIMEIEGPLELISKDDVLFSWLGEEITGKQQYSNYSLAQANAIHNGKNNHNGIGNNINE